MVLDKEASIYISMFNGTPFTALELATKTQD